MGEIRWTCDRVFDAVVIRDREEGWCAAFFPPASPIIHPGALKTSSDRILPQAQMMAAAPEMQAEKILVWLQKVERQSLRQEQQNRGRFDSLADANKADAANYRAMAKDIKAALAKAKEREGQP